MSMTENEAIKHLRHIIWCMGNEPPENLKDWRDIQEWEDEHNKLKQTYETSIQVLEEIQEYRAIGTVEEFKALKEKQKYCLGYRSEDGIKSPQFD